MFHEDSFDARSFDERSWWLIVLALVVKRVRQTYITLATAFTFVTATVSESRVKTRG